MVNIKLKILLFCSSICLISSRLFLCPETKDPPETVDNPNYKIGPADFYGSPLTVVVLSNQVLVNTHESYVQSIKEYFTDSFYCPSKYVIIKKEELESIISSLGDKAYSTFIDKNGLDMSEGIYYITNTKGDGDYNKIFMILKDNEIKFEDFDPVTYIINPSSTQKFHAICKLNISKVELVFPNDKRDFEYNTEIEIRVNSYENLIAYLWKINDDIIKKENVTITLSSIGVNNVEFWGKYVNGEMEYLCDIFYVSAEKISDEQEFDESKIKKITTEFKMDYTGAVTFTTSNCPVAPRDDGGYYVAVSNTDKILHILSFDKNDNLIKDFDTKERARAHDITATFCGFAVYVMDADNRNHAYITIYSKNFKKINRVQVMNNNREDQDTDSTPDKQLTRYNNKGVIEFYMRFIYQADNAKLVYSRGRIALIFAHYNYFTDEKMGHNADALATFNDALQDLDFGFIWGASHSLIQSATFDDNYFWTASLSDYAPQGIKVKYTSKKEFQNNYDAVAKKNNLRVNGGNDTLAGTIKGYANGWADGRLGGMLYFDKLELYALIYAKTPNYSEDEKNNKTIIYITTWKFTNGNIEQMKVQEIKVFETGNVMQLRSGKLGNDKIFIMYHETSTWGHNHYGNVPKGTIPKIFVVKLPDFEIIKKDEAIDNILMNTNEDLRTFRDGVLIWATSDSNNNLVINKIGNANADIDKNSNADINYCYDLEIAGENEEDNTDESQSINVNEKDSGSYGTNYEIQFSPDIESTNLLMMPDSTIISTKSSTIIKTSLINDESSNILNTDNSLLYGPSNVVITDNSLLKESSSILNTDNSLLIETSNIQNTDNPSINESSNILITDNSTLIESSKLTDNLLSSESTIVSNISSTNQLSSIKVSTSIDNSIASTITNNITEITSTIQTILSTLQTTSNNSTASTIEKIIFILQIQMINNRLKLYILSTYAMSKDESITFIINIYSVNSGRILQKNELKEIKFTLPENYNGNTDSVIDLISVEEFSEDSRATLVNLKTSDDIEVKLNENENNLDTEKVKEEIKNGGIDYSNLSSGYKIYHYSIASSTQGCEFNLFSEGNIQDSNNKNISLNFVEVNNDNNNITAQCIISNTNRNKIPCTLGSNINNSYNLKPYLYSDDSETITISQSNNNSLILVCDIKKNSYRQNKNNSSGLSKGAIAGIVLGIVGVIIITIIAIVIFRRSLNKNIVGNSISSSVNNTDVIFKTAY